MPTTIQVTRLNYTMKLNILGNIGVREYWLVTTKNVLSIISVTIIKNNTDTVEE